MLTPHGKAVHRAGQGRPPLSRHLAARSAGAAMAALVPVYLRWIRPRVFTWGATREEAGRPMPGDGICQRPQLNATRAVTIAARPEEIWPWLVQWGWNRAGFYSYDPLDNLGRRSGRVNPNWPHSSPFMWLHIQCCRGRSSPLIWPRP